MKQFPRGYYERIKLFGMLLVQEKQVWSMFKKTMLIKIYSWLSSFEIFRSVTRKIQGGWQLVEYYRDTEYGLVHIRESDLAQNDESLFVDFFGQNEFRMTAKIHVPGFYSGRKGRWGTSRNFITLINPKDFRDNNTFQFAFEKGNLKLLKKDKSGRIEFFGFFKPQKE